MTLPNNPKRAPRDTPRTFRLTRETSEYIKILAKAHNITQADVIEHLVGREYSRFKRSKKKEEGYFKK